VKFKLGLGCALLGVALAGCHGNEAATAGSGHSTGGPKLSQLITEDVKVGTGPAVEMGDTVTMEYRGTFADGSQFDSNVPAHPDDPDKAPLSFQLAEQASVIKGWVQGILGMKLGGERKLSIPWSLAYGEAGKDSIPSETDLYFDVKLLGVVKKGHEGDYLVSDLKKGTAPAVKSGD
jgi:FKBP-type peptidyl-prolyl cis-trans isomerase